MSVKSKHSSSKKDKVGKKEKKKKIEESDEDIESSEEELDLTKECHPIGYYMNDRAEMINQMFSVIKGNKLKAMLPPILKDCDLEQLKLQCLDQLLGMSEKRITCILEGETLQTSSESEVMESDEGDSDEKNGTSSGSSSDRSDDSHEGSYTNNVDGKHKKRKGDVINEAKAGKLPKTESENAAPEQGKTLLEILELEMRARAIRALLKQSGNEKGADEAKGEEKNENGLPEVAGEVVDLTECEDEEFPVCVKKESLEEADIDKKVSTFEEKIEKSKTEKSNPVQEDEKSKRLQAELELRNKLFKKKIYRTRQQRMESEEEEKNLDKNESQSEENKISEISVNNVVVKQEPVEPEEVVVEDPEEGEISTSEDEYPVEIKQEVIEPEVPEEINDKTNDAEDFEKKMDEGAERITAIDNGTFVSNSNLENISLEVENAAENANDIAVLADKLEEAQEDDRKNVEEAPVLSISEETESQGKQEPEPESNIEETSWRDRWLQKDGVQKLVKSSKIFAKVKKRIAEKSQRAKEEVPTPYEANSDSNSNSKLEVIEGSIEEYERLLAKAKENNFSENGNSQQSAGNEEVPNTKETQNFPQNS